MLAGLSALGEKHDLTPVLVAARDITGGNKLTAADVELSWWPAAIVPKLAFTQPSEVIEKTLVSSVTTRTPITQYDLLTSPNLVAKDMVALPIVFASSIPIELLTVGSSIDIIGADPSSGATKILASGVRVVSIPNSGSNAFGSTSQVVLVEVTPALASQLNSAASSHGLSFALR